MEKRITDPEFSECVKKNKLRVFPQGASLTHKELKTARQDYEDAVSSLTAGKFKWATIQSYYSMFHCARSLLYRSLYREKSHYCLITAIKSLYVDKGLIPAKYVEGLQRGKSLRENADYYDEWSETSAKHIIELASQFIEITEIIIKS